jgi:hypothetical protein
LDACSHTFKVPRMKCLVDSPNSGHDQHKLLLLDESIPAGRLTGLPDPVKERILMEGFTVLEHEVHMGYEQMVYEDVLRVW